MATVPIHGHRYSLTAPKAARRSPECLKCIPSGPSDPEAATMLLETTTKLHAVCWCRQVAAISALRLSPHKRKANPLPWSPGGFLTMEPMLGVPFDENVFLNRRGA